MDCKQVREKMVEMLTDTLPVGEEDRLQEHLNGCEDCDQEMETISAGDRHLKTFVENEDLNNTFLTAGRLEKLEKEMDEGSKIINLYRLTSVAAGAAAVIVAIVFLPTWLRKAGPRTVESSQKTVKSEDASRVGDHEKTEDSPQLTSQSDFGPRSEWQISSAGLKRQSEENDDRDKVYTASAQELMGERAPENPRAEEKGMHRTDEENVYVPVQKSLYDSERDGYWW